MNELKRLIASLTLRQKVSVLVVAGVVSLGLWGLVRWNRERDFRPLYTGLAPEDAGRVVASLRQSATPYRVSDGGTAIMVPSAQVAETRLNMATSGLPQSGRIGFELFDKTNFGATDFAEQVNYHRALEGELERSVMAMQGAEQARVHLTMPRDSVFLESRRPAKASVMVKLRPEVRLTPENVQALCHLVSSAVDGLDPETVSVLDMRGNLLNRPRKTATQDGPDPSDATLEYRQSIEKDLLAKINSTLEPLLGPDGFRAGVSVECDFTSGEQSEELFDPSHSVMTSSERTEDANGSATASGVPGTASNLPQPAPRPASGNTGFTRRTENVAYQSSRTVRRVRLPQGDIKRISVSLLVDHDVRWEGEGDSAKRLLVAPSAEKIKAIHDLVIGATGLKLDRGDQLIVETLPFESTLNWRAPEEAPPAPPASGLPLPSWLEPLVKDHQVLLLAGVGGAAALALILVIGFFLMRKRRGAKRMTAVSTVRALPGSEGAMSELEEGEDVEAKMHEQLTEQAALRARLEAEALQSLKVPTVKTKKAEVLTKHITEEAEKDPAAMAQLIRTWLDGERA